MSTPTAAKLYFEAQAPRYDLRSSSGLWAKVRERESRAVLRLLGPLIGRQVLDLGCGSGFYSERIRGRGGIPHGVDASPAMIAELAKKNLAGTCADVLTLRLRRTFDRIVAAGLLEFLDDEDAFFRVARTHAESGARLVMLVPRAGLVGRAYELVHEWSGCSTRARSVDDIRAAAGKRGWELIDVKSAGPLALALRFEAKGAT